jgi:hypothetical protein
LRIGGYSRPWPATPTDYAIHTLALTRTPRPALSYLPFRPPSSGSCSIVEYSTPEEAAAARTLSDTELGERKILVREDRGPRPAGEAPPRKTRGTGTRGARGGSRGGAAAGGAPPAERAERAPRAPRVRAPGGGGAARSDVAPGTSLYVGNVSSMRTRGMRGKRH